MGEYPDRFAFSVSHTTRKKRDKEIHGKHYYFTTQEEFSKVKIKI
jgi:guanylate kinase